MLSNTCTKPITTPVLQETNKQFALRILQQLIERGVQEVCFCPGIRNVALLQALKQLDCLKIYFFYEERAAAFFALGRSRVTGVPVAVMVTSGTAVGELLPATMESYYTGVPLILLTADRPRRFRGTGAPQSAEQQAIFGIYTPFHLDIAANEPFTWGDWNCQAPAHINAMFEDPLREQTLYYAATSRENEETSHRAENSLEQFLESVNYPFAIVSTLPPNTQESAVRFLLRLQIPVYLEAISGIREDPRLQHLRIVRGEHIWKFATKAGYPIDGVLRIGGVPTLGFWRDLESKQGEIALCSISHLPFSGLSWGSVLCADLSEFFSSHPVQHSSFSRSTSWLLADYHYRQAMQRLFEEEPTAEQSLVHALSCHIPEKAQIYLGNSLPIREWDFFATSLARGYSCFASRGLNGIDGQISTFLGMAVPSRECWAIVGDLTALYDLASPWIISQIENHACQILVINNKGGQLFSKLITDKEILNEHNISFCDWAHMWGMEYTVWNTIPSHLEKSRRHRVIEMIPDNRATERFWKKLSSLI
jgi:2-succinyl-5-enolpyruvyl-6-hydroxy-3-cyclohexene-1-carboxylate synthase